MSLPSLRNTSAPSAPSFRPTELLPRPPNTVSTPFSPIELLPWLPKIRLVPPSSTSAVVAEASHLGVISAHVVQKIAAAVAEDDVVADPDPDRVRCRRSNRCRRRWSRPPAAVVTRIVSSPSPPNSCIAPTSVPPSPTLSFSVPPFTVPVLPAFSTTVSFAGVAGDACASPAAGEDAIAAGEPDDRPGPRIGRRLVENIYAGSARCAVSH